MLKLTEALSTLSRNICSVLQASEIPTNAWKMPERDPQTNARLVYDDHYLTANGARIVCGTRDFAGSELSITGLLKKEPDGLTTPYYFVGNILMTEEQISKLPETERKKVKKLLMLYP